MSAIRSSPRFDLDDRLLDFAVAVCRIVSYLPTHDLGRHVAGQLIRAGTSAGANYAEARAAESRRDFIHKIKLVLKELRESQFWLQLSKRLSLAKDKQLDDAIDECDELIAIFVRSVATARRRQGK